eukprot:scaffold36693_cov32-Tisochrysis_lutea.AAC.1
MLQCASTSSTVGGRDIKTAPMHDKLHMLSSGGGGLALEPGRDAALLKALQHLEASRYSFRLHTLVTARTSPKLPPTPSALQQHQTQVSGRKHVDCAYMRFRRLCLYPSHPAALSALRAYVDAKTEDERVVGVRKALASSIRHATTARLPMCLPPAPC